jgi:hypothetical protein
MFWRFFKQNAHLHSPLNTAHYVVRNSCMYIHQFYTPNSTCSSRTYFWKSVGNKAGTFWHVTRPPRGRWGKQNVYSTSSLWSKPACSCRLYEDVGGTGDAKKSIKLQRNYKRTNVIIVSSNGNISKSSTYERGLTYHVKVIRSSIFFIY